ncbi:MAG: hypothetical protein H5U40_09210, partial [Polyangiaceae bacterium]|nr:hypothetical protein [Polyangiaceae bacterium]
MVDRIPLGSLPPSALDLDVTSDSERRLLRVWWAAGVALSLASGVAGYLAVRMIG